MGDIAIRVEGLSKRYQIGTTQEPYYTLRETLTESLARPFQQLWRFFSPNGAGSPTPEASSIWALRDVSFEIKCGEVVGIIGSNGAGKSTLLKILSRITEPTEGRAKIHGRVGSLLEVGTGFHPELTGRENIYLNGAILGMKKAEIDRKFDEIVAFAEVEQFIDTPVKHYSSGMYLRLAFAVAAHLEPEILIVDEVLAVGDAAFQKKCLGKMGDVAKVGRTILFVSHQLNQIRRLCNRCLWLDEGCLRAYGPTVEVVSAYEATMFGVPDQERKGPGRASSGQAARFLQWSICDPSDTKSNVLQTMGPCTFSFVVELNKGIRNGAHGIALWNSDGQLMGGWAAYKLRLEEGIQELVFTLPGLPLRPGVYHWQVSLYEDGGLLDNWYCVPELIIATEPQTHPRDECSGILNVPCKFQIRPSGKVR